jgi:hypothetical protein
MPAHGPLLQSLFQAHSAFAAKKDARLQRSSAPGTKRRSGWNRGAPRLYGGRGRRWRRRRCSPGWPAALPAKSVASIQRAAALGALLLRHRLFARRNGFDFGRIHIEPNIGSNLDCDKFVLAAYKPAVDPAGCDHMIVDPQILDHLLQFPLFPLARQNECQVQNKPQNDKWDE